MSGVFGVVSARPIENLPALADAMAARLRHVPWAVTHTYVAAADRVALGQIGIGLLNRGAQPTRDASGSLALMLAGEIYAITGAPDLQKALGTIDDEQLILAAYTRFGDDFVSHLDGQFVLALWDADHQRVLIANDHMGLYPTYVTQVGDRLIFAPEVKALLLHEGVTPTLRDDALAEYVRFQRVLGLKTFFAGIDQLKPGTLMTFDLASGAVASHTYWDLRETVKTLKIDQNEAYEEGGRLLRAAVHKRIKGSLRPGVFLSGGMDSRFMLGFAGEKAPGLPTFTYGTPDSLDAYTAQKLARIAHSPNFMFPVSDGRWILDLVDQHLELTEGFHSWVHMHGLHMLEAVRESADVNYSGLGDLVWADGHWNPPCIDQAVDDLAFRSILFNFYVNRYTWPSLWDNEERNLYTEPYLQRVNGLAQESMERELAQFESLAPRLRLFLFNNHNHTLRHILYHAVYGRAYLEYRMPYTDKALMPFLFGMPLNVNINLLRPAILERELPQLARVPYSGDDVPITVDERKRKAYKAVRNTRRAVHKALPSLFTPRARFHMDYEKWLRTDLFPWAQAILLDPRTIQRGIFREDALQSLVRRVQSANEPALIGKVTQLMTLEMMLRRLSDGDAPAKGVLA